MWKGSDAKFFYWRLQKETLRFGIDDVAREQILTENN